MGVLAIGLQIFLFFLVMGVALVAIRATEQGMLLRRRMRNRPAAAETSTGEGLIKSSKIENRALAWIQARLPTGSGRGPSRLSLTLAEAGFEAPSAGSWYVLIRVATAVGLPLLLVLVQQVVPAPLTGLKLMIGTLILCGLGLVVPAMVVDLRVADRRQRIEHQFPDALDLMVVCVEAGLGVDAAFVRVSQEIAPSHPDISREFNRVSQELRAGRSRSDALRIMAERVHVDALRAFAALMIQTDSLGASITQCLRSYSSELRETRFLKGEEKAMRIPVLLTMPLVACILPVIITALLLPAGLDVAHHLLPALKRH
jgi:tight adherence protein C